MQNAKWRRTKLACRSHFAFCILCQCPRGRRGLTLFEVLISLAIFVGSLAALGQLISSGVRGAVQARLQTQAVLRCESLVAEIVSGALAAQSVNGAAFADDPTWLYSVAVSTGPHQNLFLVQVTVSHSASNNIGNVSFTLHRYMRNPQIYIDAAAAKEAEALEEANSTSTSTTGGTTQ